jgi:hypothetical protein
MPIKCSLFLENDEPVCGWSELSWIPGTDLNNAVTYLPLWLAERIKISASDIKVIGARASVPGSPRRFYTTTFDTANTGTFNAETESTEPWTALLANLRNGFAVHCNRYWHGVPQTQVTAGNYIPTGPYNTAVGNYVTWLSGNSGLYAKDLGAPGHPLTYFTITDAEVTRVRSHRVGRPFALLRGRRRVA